MEDGKRKPGYCDFHLLFSILYPLSCASMPLPDLIEIVPLDKPVRAEITVPGSKSITNRALILAALADGEITLARRALERGHAGDGRGAAETRISNQGGAGPGGILQSHHHGQWTWRKDSERAARRSKPLELFVGNAGTAARFLAALFVWATAFIG